MMKKIYFVRHGVTEGNEKNEYQHGTIPLSQLGLKQATFVARRFKDIPIDIIIASDYKRATQTADAISQEIGKPILHSELFREITRPTDVRGKAKDDPEVAKIMNEVQERFGDKDWHHSDEENFFDLRARAEKGLKYLASVEEENVLVVTHGHILNMFMAVMAMGDSLSPDLFKHINRFFIPKNTGITIVEENGGNYFLLTWNDHVHMGDVDEDDMK